MRVRAHILLLAVALCACGNDDTIARLLEHSGAVARSASASPEAWHTAASGDRFRCGDGVRTEAAASARMALVRGDNRFRLKERTLIRFACAGVNTGFRVEFGESEIEAGPEGGELILDVGTVKLSPSGRYRVRADNDQGTSRFDVVVGTAVVARDGSEPEELRAGQGLELAVGTAVVRRISADDLDADATDPAAGTSGSDPAETSDSASAELIAQVQGKPAEARAPDSSDWRSLAPGEHTLAPGTTLRLGRRTKAAIARGSQRATVSGPAELVVGAEGGSLLDARRGETLIQATGAPVRVHVPGGTVVSQPSAGSSSSTRVDIDKKRTTIAPLGGTTELISHTGSRERLELGERAVIDHKGSIQVLERQPERAELTVVAGQSATIHDPAPPVAVGIRMADECPDEAVVELSPRSSFSGKVLMSKGRGSANVLMPTGTRYYRVRCLDGGVPEDQVRAQGKLTVERDSATRPLPERPPSNLVDADGRRYTVLYQNLLPEITFRWPRVQGAGPYKLHIDPKRGSTKVENAKGPSHRMRAGSLSEGEYEYYFTRGSERSKTSILRIEFDNAAPSAYLAAPTAKQAWTGKSVRVAGAALPGWNVKVNGTPVDLDRQGRFEAAQPLPVESGVIVVELAHPSRGMHYYLRRDASRR